MTSATQSRSDESVGYGNWVRLRLEYALQKIVDQNHVLVEQQKLLIARSKPVD